MSARWMLYGAYGYTGRLIAVEAAKRGLDPLLAGRREEPLRALAEKLNLEYRVLGLEDGSALHEALQPLGAVLHCAGPFQRTAEPMMRACLAARTTYLDISGEIAVFELAHGLNGEAHEAGIALVPGTGFDVVPTDCLAIKLRDALPDARSLVIGFEAHGGLSPGTARTSVEGLARGGRARRGGRVVRVPLGWRTREFMFNNRRRTAVTIPWGDVYTAGVSTGIPDVEVYLSAPDRLIRRLKLLRWIRWLLAIPLVRNRLRRMAGGSASGPDEGRRARSPAYIVGEVANARGERRRARMVTPNGYTLTVHASLGILERALEDGLPAGFHTPGQAMGSDYAQSLPGVEFRLDEA